MSGSRSLTGVWQGRYHYPRALAPVTFVATLIETGSLVTGTTHEAGSAIGSPLAMVYATLSGHRSGDHLLMTKTYDEATGHGRPIEYEGGINAEATEISGNWIIFGVWGGTFQMIREPGATAKARRRASIGIR